MITPDGARASFYEQPDLSTVGDLDLVAGIEHSHFEAMAEIYERHSGHVHALAVQVWGTERGDQVVQDVFMHLWQTPASFDPDHGSLGVHLTMQVRLWLGLASDDVVVERRVEGRPSPDRRPRSGLGSLRSRITDRAFNLPTEQVPGGRREETT